MSTSAQIAANQANAKLSTGPTTESGKAIASQNRLRYGLTGAFRVVRGESQEEFNALLDALHAEHQPATPTESVLVEKMAQSLWLARRALALQDTTLNPETLAVDDPKQLALLLRYQTTHDRAFHKCLDQLLKLRAEKRKAQIGFESQQQKKADRGRRDAAETRKQELHKWNVSLAEAKLDRQLQRNSTPPHSVISMENAA